MSNKEIENGKPTLWNEDEVSILLNAMKTSNRVSFAYTEYHGYSDETPDGDRVVAVYYQLNDDVKQEMKTVGDLSGLDWEIHHYRIG